MRNRFDSEYIRAELGRVGDQIDTPLTVFPIGGGGRWVIERRAGIIYEGLTW